MESWSSPSSPDDPAVPLEVLDQIVLSDIVPQGTHEDAPLAVTDTLALQTIIILRPGHPVARLVGRGALRVAITESALFWDSEAWLKELLLSPTDFQDPIPVAKDILCKTS